MARTPRPPTPQAAGIKGCLGFCVQGSVMTGCWGAWGKSVPAEAGCAHPQGCVQGLVPGAGQSPGVRARERVIHMNDDDLIPVWPGEFRTWIVLCARCKNREVGIATGYYEKPTNDDERTLMEDAQDQLRGYHA